MAALPKPPVDLSYHFLSKAPTVRLLPDESSSNPFGLTIAAAWSCYGARPARVENVNKLMDPTLDQGDELRGARRKRAQKLYKDLFEAGHHTTFQHANFVFVLDGVSRLAIWSFFHHHPFYNSEQVSQRYREVSGKVMITPELTDRQEKIYRAAIDRSLDGYRNLGEMLAPDVADRYAQVFPARAKARGPEAERRLADAVQKKTQEVARYVLPLATPAHFYHTINGLTLLRYYVLANQLDVPTEVRYLVNRMVEEVLEVDPFFLGAPEYPLDLKLFAQEDTLNMRRYRAWAATSLTAPMRAILPSSMPLSMAWIPGWCTSIRMQRRCWRTRSAPFSEFLPTACRTAKPSREFSIRTRTAIWDTRYSWR